MAVTLPMRYRPFTVDAEVSVEHRMYPTFDGLLYFYTSVVHFGIIDQKILEMRPFSFKTNPH